jgi:hypothetical protein
MEGEALSNPALLGSVFISEKSLVQELNINRNAGNMAANPVIRIFFI